MEACVQEFRGVFAPAPATPGYESAQASAARDWSEWLRSAPPVPQRYEEARELAAYVNWSAVVAPSGHLQRPAMYMSKNWMTNVWAWDHCFNAMALVYSDPDLAWYQLMLAFDQQDRTTGALPDCFNDRWVAWNYCKPPIHGWALGRMVAAAPGLLTTARAPELYPKLALATECWFRYRDDDAHGMPQYNHGNDSGWDNSTMSRAGTPVEGPDLAAFLALQMEALGSLSELLGVNSEAMSWRERSRDQVGALLAHCWTRTAFAAPKSGEHELLPTTSLVAYIPIVLGRRLPEAVTTALVAGLAETAAQGGFLTEWGLATEKPSGEYYTPDGYWRGPIWAPSTHLIVDGLRQLGQTGLAREIAERFCRLCSKSGFAENFDALTGAGLRDRAYTWTSSTFLVLAREMLG